jgi:acyl-coenzyme A thioesterase PaaI-like protein
MTSTALDLQRLIAVNASAGFNRMAEFEVVAAGEGAAEIRMPWNDGFTQYAGYLHGFAAATTAGRVMASHFSMNCLKPAVGRVSSPRG